uniref:leucine-rich repeat flightless-interacting protein 1 isoform X3 n=1 Tax=Jaculus jaculus TaxID=51337 RepID=UPI001E1B0846|nr:leucine-rich repeat flightless-interacting protein 1 isoform X3 [Jaculus jaculus]
MDMGTQGSGRKRLPNRERLSAEDDALNQIAREAEARLAAKRAARAEAREIRMKELERQQKEVEERPDKDFAEKGSRNMPSLSAATLASLGGTSSRRGSGDTSISMDTEASMREIKDSLAEVEEKYKKAMVSNAQLDNEKTNFVYQVDTLKDMLLELEEQLAESQRQYEEKNKEFEREKHAHSILQFQFAEVKEALRQREEMLEEIRQLQQKQASYIREISDLQETIEWKDKKIGALERQKEFFDSIRSERDDLREEVVKLKEELKKHGIVLNSEIATNGEASDTLSNTGYQGPTKMTREELSALRSAGEGTLGKAKEVEVKNEMVENVGKREILQNTEQEQHKEDREVLHPGDNPEDQKTSEDNALSPGPLAEAQCKQQAQSHILLENPGQVETSEASDLPDSRSSTSLEQSSCLGELGSEAPSPVQGHGHCNALDSQNSVGSQGKENEDLNIDLSGIIPEPCLDSIPGQTPKVDKVSCADLVGPGGNHTDNVAEAAGAAGGEQGDAVASSPLVHRDDMVSHDGRCVVNGLGPSTEQSPNREPTQDVCKPEETPEQSPQEDVEKDAGEDGDAEVRDSQPTEVGVHPVPGSPAAQSSQEDGTCPGRVDADSALLDTNEPTEDGNEQRAESVGPSQKKTKNKKKKKKKKAPAPVEPLEEVRKESTYGDAEADEVQEEGEVRLPERTQGAGAQHTARAPERSVLSNSSGEADCPESPKPQLEGKLNQEDDPIKTEVGRVTADRDTLMSAGDTLQFSDSTKDKEFDDHVTEGHTDGLAQNSPLEFECEKGNHGSLLEKKSPPKDIGDVSKIESTGQTAEKALDSLDLENGLSAPAGGLGDLSSESRGQAGGGSEKGRSKEDCTMS